MSDIVHPYADGTYYFEEPGVYRFDNGVAYKIERESSPTEIAMTCKHCGKAVVFTGHTAQGFKTDYLHTNLIRRCSPKDSGQTYGLEADYEPPTRKKETYIKGSKQPCAHPTCGFWVMYTEVGWAHIDTHGADVSGHIPRPLETRSGQKDGYR